MKRRQFITLLGGAAVAWPIAALAQQPATPVIGFLNGASADGYEPQMAAFREGLKENGYVENQNVSIEYRWANGQYDRLAALADDLVRHQVSVIVANTPANLAAKASTSTIPIVFTTGSDPVRLGLITSLSRPGGNVTGVTQLTGEVAPKRVELAHELIPKATVIAFLVNPTNLAQAESVTKASEAAAETLGLHLNVVHASTKADIDAAFTTILQMRAGALVIAPDTFLNSHTALLAELALRHLVPTIYQFRQFVVAGGLASYGGSITNSYRLAGVYTGRILKGDKAADLPVQRSTKVELFINLKTAKTLGLAIPLSLLGRADEVIE